MIACAFEHVRGVPGIRRIFRLMDTARRKRRLLDAYVFLFFQPVENGARHSLYNLVSTSEQRGRNGETDRLRGLEVNEELELGRGFYRKI
jgi:hypothetical protein